MIFSEDSKMIDCKICHNSTGNKSHLTREMMFGYRDSFDYLECQACGCLQISSIPNTLSKYYPENYYSFDNVSFIKKDFLRNFVATQRAEYYLYQQNILGMILSRKYAKHTSYSNSSLHFFDWLRKAKVKLYYKILDVGCGAGQLLNDLREQGFSKLIGTDCFIKDNIFYDNGVKILKKDITELEEEFDFIMLNHSFEHMPEPLSALKELWRVLKPNRYVLIRIPVASSFAWRKYGINWFQLDAPRHFFLHTIESMKLLSNQVGFQVKDIVFDSTEIQLWGSEKYLRDIPFREDNENFNLSEEDLISFKAQADELNKNNDGDQACFYLYKP